MFTVRYAEMPLVTWDDGRLSGDPHAVDYIRKRAAAGGVVPATVINTDIAVGLADAYQAYCTIYAALLPTVWGGMTAVDGDIGQPPFPDFDPNVVY